MLKPSRSEEKKELKKHSATVQIQNKITLLQRKTWNALLWNAYNDLPTKDVHSIQLQEIARLVGYDSKDEKHLRDMTLAMMHCIVEWDILDKDGADVWGAAVLLASVQIHKGVCSYGFAPHLRHKLFNPAMFARLDLDMQKRFESKYALALWELCTDYLGAKRDYGETPWIALHNFRQLMGVADHQYTLYKLFSQRVLSPALAEINCVSDFRVTVEYQRQGRKIIAMKFKIRRIVLPPELESAQGQLVPEVDDIPRVVQELQEAGLAMHEALDIWQRGFDFVEEAARPPDIRGDVETAFLQYVREKIHLLKRRQASGKVENDTGFLHEALKKNYANPAFAQEERRHKMAEVQQTTKARARKKKQLEAQLTQLKDVYEQALTTAFKDIARVSPDVLDVALSALIRENSFLRHYYQADKSPLENYHAHILLQEALNPALEQSAPERIQAVRERYTGEMATLEAEIAALA